MRSNMGFMKRRIDFSQLAFCHSESHFQSVSYFWQHPQALESPRSWLRILEHNLHLSRFWADGQTMEALEDRWSHLRELTPRRILLHIWCHLNYMWVWFLMKIWIWQVTIMFTLFLEDDDIMLVFAPSQAKMPKGDKVPEESLRQRPFDVGFFCHCAC